MRNILSKTTIERLRQYVIYIYVTCVIERSRNMRKVLKKTGKQCGSGTVEMRYV